MHGLYSLALLRIEFVQKIHSYLLDFICCGWSMARRTLAMFAQVVPGIDAALVTVVPFEVNSVLSNRIRRFRPQLGFIHRQQRRSLLDRNARLASIGGTLLRTGGTRTRIPQPLKGIAARVTVFPFDINTRAGGDVYLD